MAEGLRRFKKKNLATREGLLHYLTKPQLAADPPASLTTTHRLEQREVEGFATYRVVPLSGQCEAAVLYLHGGAYVAQITRQHWNFIGRLADRLGCLVEVPIYGLAPTYTYREAFPLVQALYRELIAGRAPRQLSLMGDSSGGGIALALAQTLRASSLAQPGNIVLLSPWLDITLTNPGMEAVEHLDPWLSRPGLREAGRAWAGGDDPSGPLLSPINGSLAGLAPISLFIGTHDICIADARRLRDLAAAAGAPLNYLEYQAMFHTWMLSAIPEADHTLEQIVTVLRR
ncbi:MAG: alpha/beta hydrolase [Actinomycetota bacterium]